jgi:hypothetical protein
MDSQEIQKLQDELAKVRSNIDGWKVVQEEIKSKLYDAGYFNILQNQLNEWWLTTQELKFVKAAESALRKDVFEKAFPKPVEGTNKINLGSGWQLKATYGYNRKVITDVLFENTEQLIKLEVPIDMLIRYKPEISVTIYKLLTDEQKKLFDQCITVTPGSPALELVTPKAGKK